jgi:hypothetical protein
MERQMSEYPGDLLPSYLFSSLPHLHERVIFDPSKPSGVRVLGRSMFMLAAGWLLATGWLWLIGLKHPGLLTQLSAGETIAAAVIPAALMVLIGCVFGRYIGRAPYAELEWREWRHAFGWSLVPNGLLLSTVWIILSAE